MIFAALGMAVIMTCIAEVASQFSEPGGPYLYTRTAFGRFAGMQIGWFHLLAVIGGEAALANLFINHLAMFVPWTANTGNRVLIVATLVVVPAAANYLGVRSGANFSTLMTLAKLSPLVLLILFGLARFAQNPQMKYPSEISSPSLANWLSAMVLLLFVFGGWEDALIPTGEVKEPRRTIPFGLGAGLLAYTVICALLQFITVSTIGAKLTDRPLAETASVLLGRGGEAYVAIAVMVSTYGAISASFLNVPRLAYSFAVRGDFPTVFATLHPRFNTPTVAILFYTFTVWALASSGTFVWLVAVSSGSMMVLYAGICASLFRLEPETLIRWHRRGFKLFWRWKSKPGRPRLPRNIRELIAQMAEQNPTWGQGRVASELSVKLGIYVSPWTVRAYWPSEPDRRWRSTSSQHWQTFVRNHARSIVASDFLVAVTARFRVLYVLVVMEVGTRRILHCNVTMHPTAAWSLQQFREALPGDHQCKFSFMTAIRSFH
jgi:basic amino acid/polyamine antiporter, APA family